MPWHSSQKVDMQSRKQLAGLYDLVYVSWILDHAHFHIEHFKLDIDSRSNMKRVSSQLVFSRQTIVTLRNTANQK